MAGSKGLGGKIDQMLVSVIERFAVTFPEDPEGLRGWVHRNFGFDLDAVTAVNAAVPTDHNGNGIPDAAE